MVVSDIVAKVLRASAADRTLEACPQRTEVLEDNTSATMTTTLKGCHLDHMSKVGLTERVYNR